MFLQGRYDRRLAVWRLLLTGVLALSMTLGWSGPASAAEEDPKSAIEAEPAEDDIDEEKEGTSESELERQLADELGADPSSTKKDRKLTDPITVVSSASGKSYMQISLDGLVAAGSSTDPDVPNLQLGAHDPSRRGFTLQNAELVLNGAVDPYFTAQANIVFVESPEGETEIELEEIYATTSSLSYNLQVRAGLFYTEFGRLNTQHPHFWDFVDQPLSHARMFGPDNLRSSGARVSWLMPVSFYSELYLGIQNAFGETLNGFGFVPGELYFGLPIVDRRVRTLGDFLYVPRYAFSVDLTDNQTLLAGTSAAFGPNGTGDDGRTKVYGVDIFWKWKSPRAIQGFPFVKVQAEGMKRRYRADPASGVEIFNDRGAYGQVVWGFRRGWTAGARYGNSGGDEGSLPPEPTGLEDRWRATLAMTWYPTEFSKLRLQYNYDDRSFFEDAKSIWLQFEFILGAHAAHKF